MARETKISFSFDEYRNKMKRAPWRVYIPADFSETGKIKNLYFKTREEARDEVNRLRDMRKESGASVVHVTAVMAQELEACAELLAPLNFDLLEVVKCVTRMSRSVRGYHKLLEIEKVFRAGLDLREQEEKSLSWEDAIKELLVLREVVQKRKPHTLAQIKHVTNRIKKEMPSFQSKILCDINADDCREMIGKCFSTPKQQDNARRVLSGVFTYGIKRDWCRGNPMKKLDALAREEKEILALTPQEIKALFEAAPDDCIPALAIMTFAGIRPEETTKLTWDDVDFNEKVISVRGAYSKTGGTRHVSMCDSLVSWLKSYKPEKPLKICPTNWKRKWTALRAKSGWNPSTKPWPPDVLRHTYASYHAKKYKDFPLLQMEMGHASAALLRQRYTNLSGITEAATKEFWGIMVKEKMGTK